MTWLTDTFGLRHPVVGAPMAGAGEGPLAAAVSAAGGLGMVGVGPTRSAAWVREQATTAAGPGRPFGVGLMAWVLDRDDTQLQAVLDLPASLRPALVSVSFGRVEPHLARLREAGIRTAVQAGNLEEAQRAERAGADVVVARGAEGGGHGRADVGTLTLLQAVVERARVPVLAAGGIGTEAGVRAVLEAGAAGAWVGTALLLAAEAGTGPAARVRLAAASATDTAYGRVFDVGQRLAWPPEYGGRALRNAFFDRWEHRLDELAGDDEAAAELARAQRDGDAETAAVYAGQGVGLLTREEPAAAVVERLSPRPARAGSRPSPPDPSARP